MPTWINALGIGGIGAVYGYVLFYALKRYLPPVAEKPPAIKELVFLLASLGVSGAIGASVTSPVPWPTSSLRSPLKLPIA
jgi:hypothetical protein